MQIFVAGATGAIGRPLIAQLQAQGHDVVALTRSPEKAQTLAEQGVESAIADVFDADAVKAALKSAQPEVVIEQLTSLPKTYTGESMSAAAALNTRIRREGAANVLAAAQAAGVRRYLRQLIAFWAVPGAGLADEETPLAFDASPAVAADILTVTEIERRLLGNPNIEGIALRYGFFYEPGTWFAPDGDVAKQVRQQHFPIVGNGEGVWSWLHIEDAAIATVAAVERGNPGIYLITDDRPLEVRVWLSAYAQWLKAPPPPQVSVEDALLALNLEQFSFIRHTANYPISQRPVSNMNHTLKNKRALITGGSRGIGAASVKRLASEGADVAFTYASSPDRANEMHQDLGVADALSVGMYLQTLVLCLTARGHLRRGFASGLPRNYPQRIEHPIRIIDYLWFSRWLFRS